MPVKSAACGLQMTTRRGKQVLMAIQTTRRGAINKQVLMAIMGY